MASSEEKNYFQFKHKLKNGEIRDVEVHTGTITLNDETYLLTSVFDISEKMEKEIQFKDVDEKPDLRGAANRSLRGGKLRQWQAQQEAARDRATSDDKVAPGKIDIAV